VTDRRAVLLDLARAVTPHQAVSVPASWLLEALQPPTAEIPVEDLLTVAQAAARLRVSEGYLYRRAKSLPFTRKISHRVLRFDPRGLAEWMAARGKDGRAA